MTCEFEIGEVLRGSDTTHPGNAARCRGGVACGGYVDEDEDEADGEEADRSIWEGVVLWDAMLAEDIRPVLLIDMMSGEARWVSDGTGWIQTRISRQNPPGDRRRRGGRSKAKDCRCDCGQSRTAAAVSDTPHESTDHLTL